MCMGFQPAAASSPFGGHHQKASTRRNTRPRPMSVKHTLQAHIITSLPLFPNGATPGFEMWFAGGGKTRLESAHERSLNPN